VARELPTGTVTFLFTDIEGSTKLLHELGAEQYAAALEAHRRILREAFARHGGVEVDTQGDSFFVAFSTAPAALDAAAEAQRELAAGPVRVRMGLHTGTPHVGDEGYVGADVHRAARIAAAGHGGQILVSSATAALVPPDGLRSLGAHRLKDLSAPERIYQLGSDPFPALASLQRTNLPIPATPFLGRDQELAEVTGLLAREDVRLLTLTGPAGTGKTRLALQGAAEASSEFPDGVFWAPLAALRDPQLVLPAAAQAVGARDGVADWVVDRRVLLLLDNFEHLMDAAGDVAGLLATCPNLQVLVTSRELLRLPGEQAYPVPPLEAEDARELFTARAKAVDPGFAPSPAVDRLCARLDHLPLALELAAARVAVLSPEQLLERLARRLDLLKAGRGVDSRQQTIRATIEWSYDLLDENERVLFERLSVFAGGCTLEAAEEVCGADIDTLQSLADKSLLRWRDERLWMLETVREYAWGRFEERDEAEALASAHADYFQSIAEPLSAGAPDNDPYEARWLYDEVDNIRRAYEWIASGDVERELSFTTAAFWSLWTQGNLRELLTWLVHALDRGGAVDAWLRCQALGAAALAAANSGERELAREYARESLASARIRGDKQQIEWALRVLSFDEPDLDKRRRYLRECEQLLEELENESGRGWVTYLLGQTFADEGNFRKARESFDRAAEIFTGLGRRWEAANARVASAYAFIVIGDPATAERILTRSLRDAVDLESVSLLVECVAALGVVRADSEPALGARLLAAAQNIGDERGHPLSVEYQRGVIVEAARSVRDDLADGFEREWESGKALTLEQAVALALGEDH
jgi:predicted ATPase/class 3 adenylate cyclase